MALSDTTTVHYAIDAGVSRLTVRAFASGLLSAFGHNPVIAVRDFSGEAQLEEGTLDRASLHFTVSADSLKIENEISDKDRREMQRVMNTEVIEAQKFPEITYECSNVSVSNSGDGQFAVVLNGELSLHGVRRLQPIRAGILVQGTLLRASGEFTLRQSDYQIKPTTAVAGGLKLKDELTVIFDVVSRKQG
jgi:polyisoprenoid-binding protein YceI